MAKPEKIEETGYVAPANGYFCRPNDGYKPEEDCE